MYAAPVVVSARQADVGPRLTESVSWQKPARIGVAFVGVASAHAVYLAMGERRAAPPPKPAQYYDPKAVVSITGSLLKNFAGNTKDFEVLYARFDVYED